MTGKTLRGIAPRHRFKRLPTLMLCAWAVWALAACGSPASSADKGEVAPPGPPTAQSCGVGGPRPQRHGDASGPRRSPTPPGTYRYRTHGTSGVPGEAVRGKDLPRVTELIATRSRRFGDLVCFRLQKRYAPDLANTETYVLRGSELFLVGLRLQARGSSREVRPVPAVLFGSDSGSKWSGRFSGGTSGSYVVTGLGERTLSFDGGRLKVAGVRALVSYRGAVSGAQRMTTWISPRRRLVVLERVAMRERLGVSDVRLHFDRRLISLDPIRAGAR
jgi:hypothetical protein